VPSRSRHGCAGLVCDSMFQLLPRRVIHGVARTGNRRWLDAPVSHGAGSVPASVNVLDCLLAAAEANSEVACLARGGPLRCWTLGSARGCRRWAEEMVDAAAGLRTKNYGGIARATCIGYWRCLDDGCC
jgi:hypothetical protein